MTFGILVLPGCGGGGAASSSGSASIPAGVVAAARFVAPSGNDSNPGTIAQPFRTIQKCAAGAAPGSTCQVRAGTYYETVTPNSGVTITAYPGEVVTLDGTDAVAGWSLYQGSIYQASVTLAAADTNQVFVGTDMMTEARYPNGDDPFDVNWATAQSGSSAGTIADAALGSANWTGAKVHIWSGSDPWSHLTGSVTTSQAGKIGVQLDSAAACPDICVAPGGYYYLFGSLAALDRPREWFYDPKTASLYLWAPGGADPATLAVRAKQRTYAFDLSGRSNVQISGINLFASSIKTDQASAHNVLDGLHASYVSHFTALRDLPTVPNSSWNAHVADSGLILNGTGNVLRNSTIAYSAGNGVAVLGSGNIVQNNLIHHVDYIANNAAGIAVVGSGHVIRNNTIYAAGRFGIYPTSAPTGVAPAHIDIGYNNLYNTMLLSRDGAAIYASGESMAGMHVHHNWIHDALALTGAAAAGYPIAGVYIDNGASGFEIDQNVLWNLAQQSIFLHGSGAATPDSNSVHNNSVPDAAAGARIWLGNIPRCGATRVVDNLVLVPVAATALDPACAIGNNGVAAPGATEMAAAPAVGCNMAGCPATAPPAIVGGAVAASIVLAPQSTSVASGSSASFTVHAAGSGRLAYQWFKNGVAIAGAAQASYQTPPTTLADNGAILTVQVQNAAGAVRSGGATLTVQGG